jgi:uncharacterized protein (TIGR03435 family)
MLLTQLHRFLITLFSDQRQCLRLLFTSRQTPSGVTLWSSTSRGQDETHRPCFGSVLQKQPGLRLESTRVPVDIIVIDHAEKPSEN